jgi:molybdopterin-guanine dinucleotide biosynthesis protein A
MRDRTVLILAGGKNTRLPHVVNKCLLNVNGEPNLCRTVRLLMKLADPFRVYIVGQSYCCDTHSHHVGKAEPQATMGRSIALHAEGEGHCVVLLGDVVWQFEELQQVCSGRLNTVFWHRENLYTGKNHKEHLGAVCAQRSLEDVAGIGALRELRHKAYFEERPLSGWSDDIDDETDLRERLPILERLARRVDQP